MVNNYRNEPYNVADRAIYEWKSATYQSLKEIGLWVHALLTLTVNTPGCWICGSMDHITGHHTAGRKHDEYHVIPVCQACHAYLSNEQKTWDRRWLKGNQPETIRTAFLFQGLRNILRRKAIVTGNSNYSTLADRFTEDIKRLLEVE